MLKRRKKISRIHPNRKEKEISMKKKQKQHYTGKKWIAALVVIVLIFAAIYYYIALPAINIHNPELWKFVLFVLVIAFALYALPKTTFTGDRRHPVNFSRATIKQRLLNFWPLLSLSLLPPTLLAHFYLLQLLMLPNTRSS